MALQRTLKKHADRRADATAAGGESPAPRASAAQPDPALWLKAVRAGEPLTRAAAAAAHCRACDLWQRATQTVFGRGNSTARLILVGEQPGDQEDVRGEPFVGPAGRVLDDALAAAGIDRSRVYVTNVVKHFSWEERGKWRIHKKPRPHQIRACRPWLEAEIEAIKPHAIVCLGATAAQALLGPAFRVTKQRGVPIPSSLAPYVMATVHPSSLLRAPDADTRRIETERFVADLNRVAHVLASHDDRPRGPRRNGSPSDEVELTRKLGRARSPRARG